MREHTYNKNLIIYYNIINNEQINQILISFQTSASVFSVGTPLVLVRIK